MDRLIGGTGDDILDGGSEDDSLVGKGGNDKLYGGSGSDLLIGGTGDDLLQGATIATTDQQDILIGETGADIFVLDSFYQALSSYATILDFSSGELDKIRVAGNISGYSLEIIQGNTSILQGNNLIAIVNNVAVTQSDLISVT
ncbi:hypothetical protein IQ260_29850 [Leptolyngbya cf. ectocarpi LEGE 11479]|uniref:Calcium-binding protein n=2 Tax=Leptolyngbya ectocarpi TaxID=1202 RepID=A0A929A0C8_LEPEC|nr:hypothetical protein [Leptolyngbya cf. ectocarpi LEGE 11479]